MNLIDFCRIISLDSASLFGILRTIRPWTGSTPCGCSPGWSSAAASPQAAHDLGLPRSTVTQWSSSSRNGSACGCCSAPRARCARRSTARPITAAAWPSSTDVEDAEGAFRGRQAQGPAARGRAGHARAALPDARPAGFLRALSRHRNRDERERPLGRPRARRRRLRAALRRHARQRSRRAQRDGAAAYHGWRTRLSRTARRAEHDRRSGAASRGRPAIDHDRRDYAVRVPRWHGCRAGRNRDAVHLHRHRDVSGQLFSSASVSPRCRCSTSSAISRRAAWCGCCRAIRYRPVPSRCSIRATANSRRACALFIDWVVQRFAIGGTGEQA